ncbi:MAG: sulfatase [Planctomycetes bacterium]|nr:sulfatase [Planctomycetota bacterium]
MTKPARIALSRRHFLRSTVGGLGAIAFGSLQDPAKLALPHFAPRCKRVIHLYMAGGPSHLETFDYKPELAKRHGEVMPTSITEGQPVAQLQGQALKCFAPQHPFAKYGESQQEICTLFPQIGSIADELCVVRSMHTEQINHDPAHTFMNSGTQISGRPSMGSWVTYGLGSESQNLPGFIVMTSVGKGGQSQPIASRQWSAGFLPSRYQGVNFRGTGDPVLYLSRPDGLTPEQQRELIDAVAAMNGEHQQRVDDPEVATRISQYEMAFRMQTSVPELTDLSDEPESVFEEYGTQGADGSYAANCLMARRLAERGVRFIQLYHRAWDHHGAIKRSMEITAQEVDQATAALIRDLKRRGMLEDTLILWGGEFGRTPMGQGNGRDHHIRGFSMFLAGGGIRGGMSYGATDDFGYHAVEQRVHVNDLHATILHLLGVDHERLTFRTQGRNFRLTDVAGEVRHDWMA